MSELEQAKQQIERDRQQAQEQRSMLEQARTEESKREIEIGEQKSKLPTPSQRLLRAGMFSGLEGRKRRQLVSQAKGQLESDEQSIGKIKTYLGEFEEKELKPFESDIKQREGEIQEYETHQKAIELAQDVYYGSKDGGVFFFGSNPLAKKYYDRMVKFDSVQVKSDVQVSELTSTSPSIQMSVFSKPVFVGGKLAGYEDPVQKKTFLVDSPFKKPSFTFSPPRDLSRTDLKKDFNPMSTFKFPDTSSVLDRPFTTTGSPIRRTKLTSPSPLRPPTPSKPQPFRMTSFITREIPKIQKEPKKKSTFGFVETKKTKKKKSFWGI